MTKITKYYLKYENNKINFFWKKKQLKLILFTFYHTNEENIKYK